MKKTLLASILFLLAGCSHGTRTANQTTHPTPEPVVSREAADRPTVILSASGEPAGERRTVYEDGEYVFVARGYGPKGGQTPGLFVFSHKMKKWMEIKKLSTQDAKLGRSPSFEEERTKGAFCSVAWDYSGLRETEYAEIPLRTSGSLDFPDKILYQADTAVYLLQFDSSWGIDPVLTQFIVKKDDLDKAFDKQGASVPEQGAEGDAVNRAP